MSPYPFRKLPFKAINSKGTELTIPPGTTVVDLLKIFYGEIPVESARLSYGFVSRDDKERNYSPKDEDPFIFRGEGSKHEFFKSSLELRQILIDFWKAMDLPLKKDDKRELPSMDTEPLINQGLKGDSKALAQIEHHYDDIVFATSNLDIANKFCLVRSVSPGWWCHSYAGKQPPDFQYFKASIEAHMYAIQEGRKHGHYKSKLVSLTSSNGDPLETNPGFWNYNASGTKEQLPAGKLDLITALSNVGTQGYDWDKVVDFVRKKTPEGPLKNYPFAVALLRRMQAGYKADTHCFDITATGMVSNCDVQGMNTVRIAFIFPYILNLMLTPLQLRLKTARYFLPGSYHDADIKNARSVGYYQSNKASNKKLYMAEADFSNYDRYLWIGVMNYIIASCYNDKTKRDYYTNMFTHTYTKMPLIYPDYNTGSGSVAHIVVPRSLGLLSGGKPTGEVGTFYNSIVTGAGLLNKNIISLNDYKDYLLEGMLKGRPGHAFEHNLFQSDDNLIQDHSVKGLLLKMESFKESVTNAGLKASIEIGDRFLMRHCSNNSDLPVPSRVYQNTLSGEDGIKEPIKFSVGFAMRTDGMMGIKSIDPFKTGQIHTVPAIQVVYSLAIVKRLLNFFKTAAIPVRACIDLAEMLVKAGEASLSKANLTYSETNLKQYVHVKVTGVRSFLDPLTEMRTRLVHILAQEELNKRQAQLFNTNKSLISTLKLDSNVPSQAYLMEQLIKIDSSYASAVTAMDEKEHRFFKFAMKTMNLDQELDYVD